MFILSHGVTFPDTNLYDTNAITRNCFAGWSKSLVIEVVAQKPDILLHW